MEPDNEQFIKLAKFCLIMAGLWQKPLKQNEIIRKVYAIYQVVPATFFCFIYLLIVVELTRFIIMGNDVDYVITSIGLLITETRILGRLLIFRRNKILDLLDVVVNAEGKVWKANDKEIKSTYLEYIKMSWRYGICQLATSFLTVTIFVITGVLGNHKLRAFNQTHNKTMEIHYLYPYYFPGNKLDHLIVTYIVDTFFAFWSVAIHSTTHVILTTLFTYAASQLHILRIQIGRIEFGNCDQRRQTEILQQVLWEHLELIEFVQILNSKTRTILLIEFVLCSVDISSAAVNLTAELSFQTFFFSGYFIMLFVQVLMLSWTANEVKVQGELIGLDIFGTDWYHLTQRSKYYVLFMTMTSQRPLAFNIGPFSIMTTQTGLSILQAAYSYVSIMRRYTTH